MAATVTALALQGFEQHYALDGFDVVEIGRQHALPDSLWQNLEQDIPLPHFVTFLENLGRLPTCSDKLWQAGSHIDIQLFGTLGTLITSSRTLGDALLCLQTFFSLLQGDACLEVQIGEQYTHINYRILNNSIWPRRGDAEFTLGFLHGIVRRFVTDPQAPCWLELEDASEASHALAQALHCACQPGSSTNSLTIPTRLLEQRPAVVRSAQEQAPLPARHASLYQQLQQRLREQKRHTPLHEQVCCLILKRLTEQAPDQGEVAGELGMSRRTLRRRLAEEDCSFQQLLDQCRMQMAALKLQYTALSQTDIALCTGFSEQSAFIRAFSKWHGETPGEYRRRMQALRPLVQPANH
ncbi:MAG: helix-turn-helix domain-containing protein [Thiolinea sp.]